MKKYKKFHIRTHCNKYLVKAACKHLEKLGYKNTLSHGGAAVVHLISCYSDGNFQKCNSITNGDEITLDEFFRLTKADVVIEPEMKSYSFAPQVESGLATTRKLTKEEAADVVHFIEKIVKERVE